MIDVQYLKSRLDYCPSTGVLTWKRKTGNDRATKSWNTRFAGTEAGCIHSTGYRAILFEGVSELAHRLVWIWMTGEDPDQTIDHRDGDRLNNRWSNLRLASRSENQCNRRGRSDSASGLKGVSRNGRRWRASIMVRGVSEQLGSYPTKEAAHAAYCEAAGRLHGEFARVA